MKLEDRIKEIALKHCADYPDVENVGAWEHLWAIEGTLGGTEKANDSCHKFIRHLAAKLGLTLEETIEEWERLEEHSKTTLVRQLGDVVDITPSKVDIEEYKKPYVH